MEVSSSGYYDWLRRPSSDRELANTELDSKIQSIYAANDGRCGYRRIFKALLKQGYTYSFNRVRRRIKLMGLTAVTQRKFKVTTDSNHDNPVAPNLLARNFSATAPNQKWVGDITYIWTDQGWMYLAVIIDLFSRTVVGWAMSKNIDRHLVCSALSMALWRRKFPKGVIMHTDRGSQYCSDKYQEMLEKHGLICSMSRKGNCWDNAVAESFFKTIKAELVYLTSYKTRAEAKSSIFAYIETYYNRIRLHSSLDYSTPLEVEFRAQNAA